jgi:replicative DNA helicase
MGIYKNNSVDLEMSKELNKSYLNNVDVEVKFLATLIKYPQFIIDIQDIIRQDYFVYFINNAIFSSMLKILFEKDAEGATAKLSFSYDALFAKNPSLLDSKAVADSLDLLKHKTFADYYKAICEFEFDPQEFQDYVAIIKENGIRKKVYSTAREHQINIINFEDGRSIENIIEDNTRTQTDILINSCNSKEFQKIGEHCSNYLDRLKKRAKAGEKIGISTGFDTLDNAINFLQRGNLYTFAARPKTGKTTLLTKIAANIVEQNVPVLYIDTEMETEQEVIPRLLSLYSKINNYWIINGSFINVPEEDAAITEAERRIASLPFYHVYKPGISLSELVSLIKLWVLREVGSYVDPITGNAKTKDCVVIFDYLKVIKRSKVIKDYQLLGEMTTTLKDLAGKYGFPCITAVQNNRASVKDMDGEVVNAETAVAGSDEILQFTNYLFFLDKIRNFSRVQSGINDGIYHSYLPGMSDDKFRLKFNNAISEIEKEAKEKSLSDLIGNRLLSLVAGRQAKTHEDNNFFTLNMDFKHADFHFTGELSYSPIGIRKEK